MNESEVMNMIKQHEGFRERVYLDTVGVPTGGYGHAFHEGSKLPEAIWNEIFWHDYKQAVKDYDALGFDLDPVRRAVVVDMLFNLGWNRFVGTKDRPESGFKNTIKSIRAGDWEQAAKGMENSLWYQQVRTRAVRLVRMMRTGKP
jgi:GH24 family phage-related lysozyme (muramidase)